MCRLIISSGCLAPCGREEQPVSDEAFKIPDLWPVVPEPVIARVVGDSFPCTIATRTVIMPHRLDW